MSGRRRAAPYADTEVSPTRSKEQIDSLLREAGADGVSWSEHWAQNRAQLQFIITNEAGRKCMIRIEPPAFVARRKNWNEGKGHYDTVEKPNWAQAYRLLYYYLKGKLQAIALGLRLVEDEFLPDFVVRDQQGRETTVRELVDHQLASGEIRPALPPGQDYADAEVVR